MAQFCVLVTVMTPHSARLHRTVYAVGQTSRHAAPKSRRRIPFPALLLVTAGLAFTTLAGCKGFFTSEPTTTTTTTPSASGTDYVFVGNATTASSGTIAGYILSSGTLTEISGLPLTVSYAPTSLAVSPNNSFLYLASETTGGIYGYTIGTDGVITGIGSGAALATQIPVAMAIDPSSGYLAALSSDYSTIQIYSIDASTGDLTQVASGSATVGASIGALYFLPSDDTLYAATGTGGVTIFNFDDTTGALTASGTLKAPATSSVNAISSDSTSGYLFLAESGTTSGVGVYKIGASGALSGGTVYPAGTAPYSLAFDSSNSTLYSADRTGNKLYTFTYASSTGALTAVESYATGTTPVAVAVDSSYSDVLAVNAGGSPDLDLFPISTTTAGDLSTATTTTSTGTNPVALALSH